MAGSRQAAQDNGVRRPADIDEGETLVELGRRIRELRVSQSRTLQSLADQTGLSPSMLSLVERGKASPSLGSLVSICAALDVSMADLFGGPEDGGASAVMRRTGEQPLFRMAKGVIRRVAQSDPRSRVELSVLELDTGTATDTRIRPHAGHEYGLVLEGAITVEMDGTTFELGEGDSISYESTIPHRILNSHSSQTVVVWVNVYS